MPTTPDSSRIRAQLRHKTLADAELDALLPAALRKASRRFWTPIAVARCAAESFERHGVDRVLDVGCGPGKFCVVAADTCHAIEFTGMDHREHLVAAARNLATEMCTINADFMVSDATRAPWSKFDGFYFFNPFAENDFADDEKLDKTVELGSQRYADDVLRVSTRLAMSRIGTVIATYHGFGGPIPSCYDVIEETAIGTDVVRTWKKRRAVSEAWSFLELASGVVKVRSQEYADALDKVSAKGKKDR